MRKSKQLKDVERHAYFPGEPPGKTKESKLKHALYLKVTNKLSFILKLNHPQTEVSFLFEPHRKFKGHDALIQVYLYAVAEICNVIYGREPLEDQFPEIKLEILRVYPKETRHVWRHCDNVLIDDIEKEVIEINNKYNL